MKKITTLVLGLGLMSSSALFAGSMSDDKKMMKQDMKSEKMMNDTKMMNHGMKMKDDKMMKKDKMMDDKMTMKKDTMKSKM